MELLERAIATYCRSLGTNHNNALDAEDLLARAYEQKGDIETAAKIYASTHPRWVKHFPYNNALTHCEIIANFFVRHRRYDEARAVFRALGDSFAANPPDRSQDFDRLIAATAAVDGWPAVAEICRKYFDRVADSTSVWLRKAWIFRSVGDEERYQQVVGKVLALAPTAKSLDDQRKIVEIAALGPHEFSADQFQQLDALIQTLQRELPRATTNRQVWGYQAIGALQLRLGRLPECLTALDEAGRHEGREDRASTLLVKALCLQRLGRTAEARTAFEESESIMRPWLPEPLSEREGFLSVNQLAYLVLRREAQVALASARSKP